MRVPGGPGGQDSWRALAERGPVPPTRVVRRSEAQWPAVVGKSATVATAAMAGSSRGGATLPDVGAYRVLVPETQACGVADICPVFNEGMGVPMAGASASGWSVRV